jgi:hypothetical protein
MAALLGVVVFIGTSIGDCPPGPGCHDQDGSLILRGWMFSAIIASGFGVAVGLLALGLAKLVRRRTGDRGLVAVLVILTLVLIWWSVDPAFELLERMQAS